MSDSEWEVNEKWKHNYDFQQFEVVFEQLN